MKANYIKCAVIGAVTAMALSAHANLIVNGGFELPGPANTVYEAVPGSGDTSITGWDTFGTGVEWMNPAAYYAPFGPAYEGSYCLDVANLSDDYGGVHQNVNLTVGQTYLISFAYGTSNALGRTGITTICFDLGDYEAEVTAINTTSPAINWQTHSFYYTASHPVTSLDLFTTVDGDEVFAFVDDVQINAVPEPATLSVIGLGALGLWRRRK